MYHNKLPSSNCICTVRLLMNNIHTSMYGLRRLSSPLMCNYSIIVKTLNTKHISWFKYIWFEFETNEWKIERNWIWILIGFLWEFLLHAVFWVIIFLIYFLHFFDCTRRKNWCFESDFVQFLTFFWNMVRNENVKLPLKLIIRQYSGCSSLS